METFDLEMAHAVGGGMTIESFVAALMRDGWPERQRMVPFSPGDTFG